MPSTGHPLPSIHLCRQNRASLLFWLIPLLMLAPKAQAIVFHDTADPAHNTTAPTGQYSSSGWQYQGMFGGFLGTMISPQLFITAQHIGVQSGSFVHDSLFNGTGDVTYTIDIAANGGVGFWDIAGTDLRIYKVHDFFPYYAELYPLSNELGKTAVTNGMGGPRGSDVTVAAELKGWTTGGSDGIARWGANEISSIESSPVGSLLAAEFNAAGVSEEAFLSSGDSGGGLFIKDGAAWKLAGVNYAVDAFHDTNNITGDNSHFTGAFFDKGGLYEGSDAGGWTFFPDAPADQPIRFYASRISTNSAAINNVIAQVPEPGSVFLLAAAMLISSRRARDSSGPTHEMSDRL